MNKKYVPMYIYKTKFDYHFELFEVDDNQITPNQYYNSGLMLFDWLYNANHYLVLETVMALALTEYYDKNIETYELKQRLWDKINIEIQPERLGVTK